MRSLSILLTLLWAAIEGIAMAADEGAYATARAAMVNEQIAARDVKNPAVLDAMRRVPRHRFVPVSEQPHAYRDTPLPIGQGQTISQPYIVALMTELAAPESSDIVLEVGTGSGYQAAVLAELVQHVYTIELEPQLARTAANVLDELGYDNVTVRSGDGYGGWPEHAPFDVIIVTAAPDHVPEALIAQLKKGGSLIVPVGPVYSVQHLRLIQKNEEGELITKEIAPVRFVPLRRGRESQD